jgi:hypothetical protein
MALPAQSASIPSGLPSEAALSANRQSEPDPSPWTRIRLREAAERDLTDNDTAVAESGASTRAGTESSDRSHAPAVTYSAEFAALLQAARPRGRIDWIRFQAPRPIARRAFGSISDYFQLVAVPAIALMAAFGTAYWPVGSFRPLPDVADRQPSRVAALPEAITPATAVSSRDADVDVDVDVPPLGTGVEFVLASKSDPVLELLPIITNQAFGPPPASPTIATAAVPTALPLLEPATQLPVAPSPLPFTMETNSGVPTSVVSNDGRPPTGEPRSAHLQTQAESIQPADGDSTAGDDSASSPSRAASSSSQRPDVNTASGSTNAPAKAEKGERGSSGTGSEGKDKNKDKGKGDNGKGDKGKGDNGKGAKH